MRRGVLLAAFLALTLPAAGAAQEGGAGERAAPAVPGLPGGVPVVLLPVQSAAPLPSGAWPAGAESRSALLERMNAELDYAFRELGSEAGDWHVPAEVVERARRNPTLDLEPRRLAVQVLAGRSEGDRVPAPLHGQLRRVAALFGARYLFLPLGLGWKAGDDVPGAGEAEAAPPDSAGGPGGREPRTTGRAALELALVDIRRGLVIWRDTVHGAAAPRDSPALLATLAARLAEGAVAR